MRDSILVQPGLQVFQPITSIAVIRRQTGLSDPTAASAVTFLIDRGIAGEITGRRRNSLFAYRQYISVLIEGTE